MLTITGAKTFQNDLHLPRLPFVRTESSLKMYLESLCALVPLHVYMEYQDHLLKMVYGDASILDFNTTKAAANLKNWIDNWWLKWYHLNTETELIPYSSICGFSSLHMNKWPENDYSQIDRGAEYLHALLIYWNCLRQEIISPERTNRGEMMSMNMYRNIFNCSRIPSSSSDIIYHFFQTVCEGYCPDHITLCIKGYVFKVNFIEKEIIWPIEKIKQTIKDIFELLKDKEPTNNVTIVTTLPKSRMFAAMQFANEDNKFITEIQESILWFSFDECKPHKDHMLMSSIGSNCHNRCGMKSLSVTVFGNGLISLYGDSAVIDPDVFIKVIQFADFHIFNNKKVDDYPLRFKYIPNMVLSQSIYSKYEVNLPQSANNELIFMGRIFNMKVFQMDCGYRYFKWFNTKIAKTFNVDPCITIHLLLLLTYWEIHKNIGSACAIVSHRKYYRGRYDMVPTITVETINWIKACQNKICSPDKLKVLFLLAHKKLLATFKYCENNCGPVLHLNYLNSTFRDISKQLKKLCDDSYWYRSGYNGHFGIRTIYLGDVHVVAIVPDVTRFGYSVSYSVDQESTLVSVIHRCSEDQLNPRLPKIFLKEFLTSTELLNQMFTS